MRVQGADIRTVAQLLGHKDLRMAARYQHLSPSFLAEAVGRLGCRFWEVSLPKTLPCQSDRSRINGNLLMVFGVPYGSRTRVAAVKGRCPRPLDERDNYKRAAGGFCKWLT